MDTHRTKRDWEFFRQTAKTIIWPKMEPEYQQELKGIAEGLKAKGVAMDLWDVVALNAMEEVPDYYVPWLERQQKGAAAPKLPPPGNCSAFVATGSMTKDHKPVIAHSNWTNFPVGSRWTIVFDIVPTHGYRIIQDGFPGIIVSDDDFGINSVGLDGDGDHHHRLFAVRSQRQAGVFAGAQGAAVRQLHRRVREDHARRQQRRLRQRLAAGRQQDRRSCALRAGTEDAQSVAHQGRLLRRREFPQRSGADQEGNGFQSQRTWAAR